MLKNLIFLIDTNQLDSTQHEKTTESLHEYFSFCDYVLIFLVLVGLRKLFIWTRCVLRWKRNASNSTSQVMNKKRNLVSFENLSSSTDSSSPHEHARMQSCNYSFTQPRQTSTPRTQGRASSSMNQERHYAPSDHDSDSLIGFAAAVATATKVFMESRRNKTLCCCKNCVTNKTT